MGQYHGFADTDHTIGIVFVSYLRFYRAMLRKYADRGYATISRPSVCLSVCDVEVWFSFLHRLVYFENNFTAE